MSDPLERFFTADPDEFVFGDEGDDDSDWEWDEGAGEGPSSFATAARAVGDVWKGPSGRWFTKNKEGRTVPTADPNKKAPEKKPRAKKVGVDEAHDLVRSAGADVQALTQALLSIRAVDVQALRAKLGHTKSAGGSRVKQKLVEDLVAKITAAAPPAKAEPAKAAPAAGGLGPPETADEPHPHLAAPDDRDWSYAQPRASERRLDEVGAAALPALARMAAADPAGRVGIGELRGQFPGVPRREFDDALRKLRRDDRVRLIAVADRHGYVKKYGKEAMYGGVPGDGENFVEIEPAAPAEAAPMADADFAALVKKAADRGDAGHTAGVAEGGVPDVSSAVKAAQVAGSVAAGRKPHPTLEGFLSIDFRKPAAWPDEGSRAKVREIAKKAFALYPDAEVQTAARMGRLPGYRASKNAYEPEIEQRDPAYAEFLRDRLGAKRAGG